MYLYNLTAMTGARKSDNKTTTFLHTDWRPRVLAVTIIFAIVGLLTGVVVYALIPNMYVALTIGSLILGGGLFLFASRTRTNQNQYQWQALKSTAKSRQRVGKFYLSGLPFTPNRNEVGILFHSTAPYNQEGTR